MKKPYILLAENDEANINVIYDYLTIQGLRVTVARNGAEALELVKNERPDLILMDAYMPKMTGYEACRKLKQMEATKGIPLVFISGKAQEHEIPQGLRLGAVEYIRKPFSVKRLAQRLGEILHGVELGIYEEN